MLRDSLETAEGRVAQMLRRDEKDYRSLQPSDVRAILQELVATRIHLALVANEKNADPEAAGALARSFLNARFPGGF